MDEEHAPPTFAVFPYLRNRMAHGSSSNSSSKTSKRLYGQWCSSWGLTEGSARPATSTNNEWSDRTTNSSITISSSTTIWQPALPAAIKVSVGHRQTAAAATTATESKRWTRTWRLGRRVARRLQAVKRCMRKQGQQWSRRRREQLWRWRPQGRYAFCIFGTIGRLINSVRSTYLILLMLLLPTLVLTPKKPKWSLIEDKAL